MSIYPTEFAPEVTPLPSYIDQSELNDKGLYVVQGLTRGLAEQMPALSQQPAVLEFTPNDYLRPDNGKPGRFFNLESTAKWLTKGRLPLPMVTASEELKGILWMGLETPGEDEPTIPGARVTFAVRIYEGATGQGNCLPYTRAGLAAHNAIYGNDGVWLEAWGDNPRALRPYSQAGFIEVARIMGERHGQQKERVYMTLGDLAANHAE